MRKETAGRSHRLYRDFVARLRQEIPRGSGFGWCRAESCSRTMRGRRKGGKTLTRGPGVPVTEREWGSVGSGEEGKGFVAWVCLLKGPNMARGGE